MTEIELKFCMDADAAERWRAALEDQGATCERLRARYFDTEDGRLAHARVALRLRQEGRRWVQTLKGEGDSAIQRLEHEVAVRTRAANGPALDIERHAGSAAEPVLARALDGTPAGALVEQYGTDVSRLSQIATTPGGTEVEIALDLGTVTAGEHSEPIAELELEHHAGPLDGLFELACEALSHGGLWLSTVSKAQRGERLSRGTALLAGEPKPLHLPADADGAALLRAVLQHALAGVLPHASTVGEGSADAASVQALRAALRRLCSALRELAPLSDALRPEWEEALADTASALGERGRDEAALAAVRPLLEVAGAPKTDCELPPAADPVAEVRAAPFQSALVQVLALAHAHDGAAAPMSRALARDAIARRLDALHRQVVSDGAHFDALDAGRQRRVRRRLRRLRDTIEWVGALWPGRAAERYRDLLKPAQDALDRHHETARAADCFREEAGRDPAALFAAGYLAARLELTRGAARKALRRLDGAKRFWK